MKYLKIIPLLFVAMILQACSDENSTDKASQTEKQNLENLKSQFGTWEELCKIRPECEDYPIGYETVIVNNFPYYFPLNVSRASRPNYFYERQPDRNFAQFSDDSKWYNRVVSLDYKTLKRDNTGKIDHRLEFTSGPGLYPLAKYLGLIAEDYENQFKGGLGGIYLVNEKGIANNLGSFFNEKTINEITNYKLDSKNDYDENFWFVRYGRDQNGKLEKDLFRSLIFVSKKPIFFNMRIGLICIAKRCSVILGNFPNDDIKDIYHKVKVYKPSSFFLGNVKGRIVHCATDNIDSCIPKKGMLVNVLPHLMNIQKIIEFITTKPADNREYWK